MSRRTGGDEVAVRKVGNRGNIAEVWNVMQPRRQNAAGKRIVLGQRMHLVAGGSRAKLQSPDAGENTYDLQESPPSDRAQNRCRTDTISIDRCAREKCAVTRHAAVASDICP
jgi:hypothetical protein